MKRSQKIAKNRALALLLGWVPWTQHSCYPLSCLTVPARWDYFKYWVLRDADGRIMVAKRTPAECIKYSTSQVTPGVNDGSTKDT